MKLDHNVVLINRKKTLKRAFDDFDIKFHEQNNSFNEKRIPFSENHKYRSVNFQKNEKLKSI